ncbi:hypothetical protein [Phaeobacter sp. SYSU ZJ3003]|uniref:hypothetical protein n=1 Tax=Phaeobacter sp. SYSU ZJ3003 TaxID=2109330 RepID=UPI00351C31E8
MKLKTLVLTIALAGSLTLNVASVAFSSVAMLVSGAYEAVTGAASVVGRKDRRMASLSDDLARKDAKLNELTDEVASLRGAKTVPYRGQKRALSEAVEDTATRVSRRTVTGAARNAGSVVAEAIPFAGIVAIIGVTAWDLKDSCDTMKDLHELEKAFNPEAAAGQEQDEVCGLAVPTKDEIWASVKSSPGEAWKAATSYVPDLPKLTTPQIDWPWN